MKKIIYFILAFLFILIVLSFINHILEPKLKDQEVLFTMEPSSNKYEKITIPMQNKNSVIFNLESIDLNIFYHKDKKSINIEYEKIINESLNNNLENTFKEFTFNVNAIENSIYINASCGRDEEKFFKRGIINIYASDNIDSYTFNIKEGKIRVFDSYKGVISGDISNSNLIIEKISGVLYIKGERSGIQVKNGKLMAGTDISLDSGNMNIKAEFNTNGPCFFETGNGNISISYKDLDKIYTKQLYSKKRSDYEYIWSNNSKSISYILAYAKAGIVNFNSY